MNNFTMVDLCSKALNKIGASEIVSFDEGTPEAEFSRSIYPVLKHKLLSSFPWSFATEIKRLNKIVIEDVEAEFSNCYLLPSDFIRAVKISSKLPYKIIGDKLFTDATGVILTYISDVDECRFSSAFVSAFIYAIAAELSVSLLDDVTKFNLLYRLYTSELREARFLDSMQESPKKFNDFSLIDVRF
ncbi:hypothetical protein HDR60_05330 [bacterium]|nr:hypothetical protein [bacterium]MDE6223921.1 hypothetical protein [Alphaproteobacteria bacterium]